MTISHKTLTIRVDESVAGSDFSLYSPDIEYAVVNWEGLTPVRWDNGDDIAKSESLLQSIADALWGGDADKDWGPDTLDAIAEAIMNVRPDLYNDRVTDPD